MIDPSRVSRHVSTPAVALAIVMAAVLLSASPGFTRAAKVANPGGSYTLQVATGFLRIKAESFSFDYEGRQPECSDGINNNDGDQDAAVDFPADLQCTSSTDDSEVAGGFQPKQPIQLTNGTIAANGTVTFPASGVSFPPRYSYINADEASGGLISDFIVTMQISARADVTGTVNPLNGAMSLHMQLRLDFDGGRLDSNCRAEPIDINTLITGTTAPPGPNTPITGFPYDEETRRATLVNNSFAVPGFQGCGSEFFVNYNDEMNNQLGLPSAAGNNEARFTVEFVTTGPQPAIVASFAANPASGPAPLTVSFDASASTSTQPVTSYQWDFTNNGSFDWSGVTTSNVYTTPGTYTVRLRVTDDQGDFAQTLRTVTVLTNLPPEAHDRSITVIEDTPWPITLTGTDPDGGALTFALASPEAIYGTVTGTPPNVTYTPASGYVGPDSFAFSVTDGSGASDTGTVTIAVAPAATFTDIGDSIFQTEIAWLAAKEITRGCNAGGTLFCPGQAVTREQMASFLVRALDLPATTQDYFVDDEESTFHEADINALRAAEITTGCGTDSVPGSPTLGQPIYCPTLDVTRAQMASFLSRALGLPAPPASEPNGGDYFTDDEDQPFHEDDINKLAYAGITLGCNEAGDEFCPDQPVTREQMAAFLFRALGD